MAASNRNPAALLAELRVAIAKCPKKGSGGHKDRYFCRRYLGMKGEKGCKRLREWLKDPSCMREDEMALVEAVLARLNATAQKSTPAQEQKSGDRRLISHAVAVLSSLKSVVSIIDSAAINDGDRMYVRSAMEEFSKRFGIKATFIDPADSRSRPATREDLVDTGLKRKR